MVSNKVKVYESSLCRQAAFCSIAGAKSWMKASGDITADEPDNSL